MAVTMRMTSIKKLRMVVDIDIVVADDDGRSAEGTLPHADDIGRWSRKVFTVGFVVSAFLRRRRRRGRRGRRGWGHRSRSSRFHGDTERSFPAPGTLPVIHFNSFQLNSVH